MGEKHSADTADAIGRRITLVGKIAVSPTGCTLHARTADIGLLKVTVKCARKGKPEPIFIFSPVPLNELRAPGTMQHLCVTSRCVLEFQFASCLKSRITTSLFTLFRRVAYSYFVQTSPSKASSRRSRYIVEWICVV